MENKPVFSWCRHTLMVLFFGICMGGCQQAQESHSHYLNHVGDTVFDATIDDTEFKVCHEDLTLQYYNFSSAIQYEGEKFSIIESFEKQYDVDRIEGEDGYITIRFVVNCEGKTGWFRVEELDMNYEPRRFNTTIVNSLLQITKALDGWQTGSSDGRIYDYYQYLTFKIDDGQILQILP